MSGLPLLLSIHSSTCPSMDPSIRAHASKDTWYYSPLPKELLRGESMIDVLYICEFTLKFFTRRVEFVRFQKKYLPNNKRRHPPGNGKPIFFSLIRCITSINSLCLKLIQNLPSMLLHALFLIFTIQW